MTDRPAGRRRALTPPRDPERIPVDTARPLPLAAFGLMLGIAGTVGLAAAETWPWGFAAIGSLAILAASWILRRGSRHLRVIGAFALLGAARVVATPAPLTVAEGYVELRGTVWRGVLDPPPSFARFATGARPVVVAVTLDAGEGPRAVDGAIRLEVPPGTAFLPRGSRIRCIARLRAPREARNPGETSERERIASAGIRAIATVDHVAALSIAPPRGLGWRLLAANDALRRALVHGFARALDPEAAALAAALLIGVRDGLDPEFLSGVAGAGTIHLLAISGMQVAWLAFVVRGLLGLFVRPRCANVTVLAFALAYADLAGAEAPVLRAGVAAALMQLGAWIGRPARPLDALAATASGLLLLDPGDLFRPGFQLSFAACFALLTRRPTPREHGDVLRRTLAFARESCGLSLRAAVATAPIVAAHFGTCAPLSPLLTLLLTPPFLAAFSVSVAFAPVALLDGMPCGAVLAVPVNLVLEFARWAFAASANLPAASVRILPPLPVTAVVILLGCEIARRIPDLASRRRRLIAASVALALGALALGIESIRGQPPAQHEIVFLDVGHGQAVLVRTPAGRAILLDAGAPAGSRPARGGDRAARTILAACGEFGIREFSLALVSHGDADHANALPTLLAGRHVRSVLHGPSFSGSTASQVIRSAARAGVAVREVRRGDSIAIDATTRLRILAPSLADSTASDNDRSLVAVLEIEGARTRRVLFPGDIQSPGIRALLARGDDLAADVLVLPHHGRDDPALGPLVRATGTLTWIASRGDYRADGLAARLAARDGARLLVTDSLGAITVRIAGDGAIRIHGFVDR